MAVMSANGNSCLLLSVRAQVQYLQTQGANSSALTKALQTYILGIAVQENVLLHSALGLWQDRMSHPMS